MTLKHVVLLKSEVRSRGGLEKAASHIAKAFIDRGARVSVLTTGEKDFYDNDISLYTTKTCRWPSFFRIEQFDYFVKKWLQKNPADLVFGMDRNRYQTHFRAGNGVHDAYLKSRILTEGKLKYYSCLLNPMHRKILDIEKKAFEHPALKKLFTNSNMVKYEILDRYSIDPKKIQVIHNGVEWKEMGQDFLNWPDRKKDLLHAYSLPTDCFHILFIGHGYLRKGLFELLKGMSLLNDPNVHLSIIGKENRLKAYKTKVEQLKISKQVTFFGPQSEIRPFYQYADALAIPSFYDPFANVTVEALAMGLFVISSKTNGGSEILSKTSGTIIEELQSPESMKEALKVAMKHRKTIESAKIRRNCVESLDFSCQMKTLIEACM
jgi:UDP-glucose:(heptosyl)LPS alpha-1,3-glucosyltransferase